MGQRKMNAWKSECDPRKGFADMTNFGLSRLQELASNRGIEKQVANFDHRSAGATARRNFADVSAIETDSFGIRVSTNM